MKGKIGIASLGCPKNQVDAEIMLAKLKSAGYEITTDESEAQVIIVNTCGFIEAAKKESIETIIELADLKKSGNLKVLVVTGCLAQRYKEELLKELPEVDTTVTLGANGNIVEIVDKAMTGEKTGCCNAPVDDLPLEGERLIINEPYYAYLKIAEGCNNRCTYCAIPLIRGKMRSRNMGDILSEAETLAENGVKELVVVAQDTTRYGEDIYGRCMLPELLKKLCAINELEWIRILYAYPDRITDELLDVIADEKKIVKYLDIPIQHCCGDVLRRMNRPGDEESLRKTIKHIREKIPGITLRTTLITGFPGETGEQFETLCNFVDEMKFERLGCFAYSAEEGTPAAKFDDQISEKLKSRRAEIITEKQSLIGEKIASDKIGNTLRVLVEGYDSYIKHYFGRSEADAPDIDCKVFFTARKKHKAGEFVNVNITDESELDLFGEETK